MKMKICFFSTSFAYHKQIRMEYMEKIFPQTISLFLLTPPAQNKYNLKRTKIIEVLGNKLNFVFELRKFCNKNKITLLNNLGGPREVFGMFFSTIFTKTEYLLNFAGNIFYNPEIHRSLKQKIFQISQNFLLTLPMVCSRKIITPSEDFKIILQKYFFFMKKRIKQLDYIIDEKLFFNRNKALIRKKLKFSKAKKILLFVGRIHFLKGSDIIRALIKKNPDKLFILIGEKMDQEFKQKEFRNVLIIDSLNSKDLALYYNLADLFLFPSRVEAYGLAPREAMLCETPVLVSKILALTLIKYAFKADLSVKDIQKSIDYFFSLPKKKRIEIGRKGRNFVINTSSFKNKKEEYLKTFLD